MILFERSDIVETLKDGLTVDAIFLQILLGQHCGNHASESNSMAPHEASCESVLHAVPKQRHVQRGDADGLGSRKKGKKKSAIQFARSQTN
jgi:hypothetical protein